MGRRLENYKIIRLSFQIKKHICQGRKQKGAKGRPANQAILAAKEILTSGRRRGHCADWGGENPKGKINKSIKKEGLGVKKRQLIESTIKEKRTGQRGPRALTKDANTCRPQKKRKQKSLRSDSKRCFALTDGNKAQKAKWRILKKQKKGMSRSGESRKCLLRSVRG